ncbi:MAG TPA: phage/plasmid primase, P4 family [Dehalococcoidia bacterium]|nr:phage/plasmid primase, P4 family [Dehalococcoidia bacterium]
MDTPVVRTSERILGFLRLIWKPGEVREFRAPKYTRFNTASGYFDDPVKLAQAAAEWDSRAQCYVTLNPVSPALLARAKNRIDPEAKNTTADQDIVRRAWLFIDVDAARPAGISSTNVERECALSVLSNAATWLTEQGWPAPITAMSGNGYYGLYAVDLPNDAASALLAKEVLDSLAARFNSTGAHIDTTVYNASRIIGLVGTKKMKGDPTEDRPHRVSELLQVPEELHVVTEVQLRALVPVKSARAPSQTAPHTGSSRPLTGLLDEKGIEYQEQPPDANGVTWYHVHRCPFHDDGADFECGVGQALPDGPYAGHCFHPEGSSKGWQDWKRALGLEVGRHESAIRLAPDTATPRRPTDFAKTDSGNAELFAHLNGENLRYDHRQRRWFIWCGQHWEEDLDGAVTRLAIDAVRQRYLDAMLLSDLEERGAQAKFAVASENRQRLDALLAIARTKLPVSDRGDSWDKDPWLLGVANGVVDLRSGCLVPGVPAQRITRFVNVRFDPLAECPRWLLFLDEVFPADRDLVDFIWKAIGYSLAGDTSEQCVFTCYGSGANGKSVLLHVLRCLLGGYAYNAPFSAFELQNRATITNDVAPMAGARLVTSSETNEGTRLNEARLKALTGNDPITTRFLYGENFTFYPQAKFWLAVNHRPRVEDQSHGFWRRVRLVPFLQTFDTNRDKHLDAKLVRELPGILAWAVRGCLAWQQGGMGVPGAVAAATESYRQDSDPLTGFIDDCCILRPDVQCGATEAYQGYLAWASARSMRESEKLSSTRFGTKLSERFEKKRNGKGVVYVGLGLLSTHHPEGRNAASVQGLVQGWESDAGSPHISSLVQSVTREESEIPYTTLHPTQSSQEGCAECGAEAWAFDAAGVPVCEEHATAGATR